MSGASYALPVTTSYALAIDPGVTTGIAFAKIENNNITVAPAQHKYELYEIFDILQSVCNRENLDQWAIIYETFEYRNVARLGLDLTPVKIIGIIELWEQWSAELTPFYPQSAATGKVFHTDQKLKELGLWPKGMQHSRDAIRHLLRWLTFGKGRTLYEALGICEMVSVDEFWGRK